MDYGYLTAAQPNARNLDELKAEYRVTFQALENLVNSVRGEYMPVDMEAGWYLGLAHLDALKREIRAGASAEELETANADYWRGLREGGAEPEEPWHWPLRTAGEQMGIVDPRAPTPEAAEQMLAMRRRMLYATGHL